jgi:outer membrane protein
MLRIFALILLGAIGIQSLWAQVPAKLSEEDIIRLALERNEINAITKNQLKQAELRLRKARSYLFPTLTANASIQKMYIVPEKRLPGGLQVNSGEVTLSQPIYTFGRLGSGIEIAKLDKDLTANAAKATRAEIVKMAKQIFYNAIYNKHVLKIAEESLANANRNKSALGERVSFGRINQNDNIKMQADVASRKPLLHEATRGYESAIQDLSYFLNIEVEEIKELDGSLFNVPNTLLVEKPVNDFVDVQTALHNRRLSAAMEELARSDFMPTLSAFASYLPKHTPTSMSLPGVLMTDTAVFGLRLDFDLPLGGAKSYERKERTLEVNNAQLNVNRVLRESSKQQKSLIQQYSTLEKKKQSLQDAVDVANRSYKVALASFRNGSIGQLQLNDSELLLTNNKISFAQNLLQMKALQTELERLQTEGKN